MTMIGECSVTTRPSLFLATTFSVACLFPLHAQAQSSMPTPPASGPSVQAATRVVSDPLFLPRKGQVYGASVFTIDKPKGDNFKAGVQTGSFTATDSLFSQTLAFGVLDTLTIRLVEGYGMNKRDSTSAATGDVTTGSSRGFNDPAISATLRVFDEPRSPFIADLTASYSPDFIAAKAGGSSGSDGTIGRGGQTAGLSLAVGRVMESFTIAATVGSTYVGQQTTEVLSNGTSTEAMSHWNYNVGLTTQTRFTDRASLDAGVSVATAQDYDVSNIDKSNTRSYSPPSSRTLNLALNYHLVPNRVVGVFTYAYNNYGESTNTFGKAASNTAVENRMGNVFGVRLLYLFN